jgi:oligoendopeptidase F
MNWDLSHLFNNYDEVDSLLKSTKERAQAFNKNNKTKLSSFSVEAFVEVFGEYETILEGVGQIMTFVFLEFATDASKGGTLAKYQKETTLIEEQLIFFELEFNTLDRALQDSFIAQAGRNAFYLYSLQKEAKFQLQEGEERILMKKDLTSSSAFSRLFDEHFSRLNFSFQGEMLSEEEILSKLYSSDRGVRKEAAYALGAVLEKNLDLTTYIYNMIKSDWAISAELRGYETALTPRNISNKIEQQSVESLIETATNNYHLVEKYYGLKAKILGIEKLEDWDRYAPISAGSSQVEFNEAKQMVLDTFEAFNPTFHAIALRAFDEKWIDVFPKEGKRGGAFSHGATTNVHPYVLLNYTNQRRDVFTLAHELGHTIHQYLAQDAGYLNQHTPFFYVLMQCVNSLCSVYSVYL